jgi:hypothetical protein
MLNKTFVMKMEKCLIFAEFIMALSLPRIGPSFPLPYPVGDVCEMLPVPASPETSADFFQREGSH